MFAINWKRQAVNDLIKIGHHIEKDSPASAERMIALIESKVAPLANHPRIGRTGRKPGTYALIAHKNYVVIYRVLPKEIEILRIKHTAERWPPA